MTRGRFLVVACLILVPATNGCGTERAAAPAAGESRGTASRTTEPTGTNGTNGIVLPAERPAEDYPMDDPPRFHVLTESGPVVLRPWTICGPGYCADGFPDDEHLVDVGGVDHLDFGFELSGWEFRDVTFRELGVRCPRAITVPARKTGERTFRVDPVGPPGRWAVDIFGRGPGGDAVTTVEWTTTSAGSSGPGPTGVAAVLADHDGRYDSYGVELALSGLDDWYADATASIRVEAASGGTVTIPLRRRGGCTHEGHMFFGAPDDRGQEAARLGDAPFTYTATVELGGTTYTGTGSWPDDEVGGNEPNVSLTWDPPLPAYRG